MIEHSVGLIGIVLALAAIVAIITRRLNFPYTAGLVIAGAVFALIPDMPLLPMSKDLIYGLLLPPLIFETAFQLKWKPFRADLAYTGTLASIGVVIATFVVGAGMHYFMGWGWLPALLFGALISATDPVSVITMFKELSVPKRLDLSVETESLLNDGTASVMFGIVMLAALGGSTGALEIGGSLIWTIVGAILVGVAIGWLALMIIGRTNDPMIEVILTIVAAYMAFIIADRYGMSGVLATTSAGLMMGNFARKGTFSEINRSQIILFWALAAFIANSFIFIMIGNNEVEQSYWSLIGTIVVAYVLTLIGRALAVYLVSLGLAPTRWRMPMPYQHVLVWGGLRGAMALALALSLPATLAGRSTIIPVTFAVVALSIFLQGLTMPALTRKLGLAQCKGPKVDEPVA